MRRLRLIQNDPYLKPYASAIRARYDYAKRKEAVLTRGTPLSDWADGYLYFGLHRTEHGWVFREWAPNATAIYIKGDMNGWQKDETYRLQAIGNGVWEKEFDCNAFVEGQLYKLLVEWQGGWGERIPSYAVRVVQDTETKLFSAQVWEVKKAKPAKRHKRKKGEQLFIYECHIGMSGEEEKVSTYEEFRLNVLPRIADLGYNCIQLMAIQEHPYYGSFGYHVSNFFAASSRFGTPEELQVLIADAHARGLSVIMDIVHSHAVKNENEGISRLDGTTDLYFHYGDRGNHPAWDSRCFNYGKHEVQQFLLSNCKYWLDEYHFDGFRFDGVTSMLYFNHGLGQDFTCYKDYFASNEDDDAILYLMLANELIHQVRPDAITIAEEMSGFPGIAGKFECGGVGFDYRLSMGVPDYWIKLIKECSDEKWPVGKIFYELQQHRPEELTINYAESHDQALVGDQTIIFRLLDKDMYTDMNTESQNMNVDRGIALHKMIRLITLFTASGGYLTFMGNEFGHPEWIDFPREGNNWSYKYARRQWSLAHADYLRYHFLLDFEKAMLDLFKQTPVPSFPYRYYDYDESQVLAFGRGDYLTVFNFSPTNSYTDYVIPVPKGRYNIVLSTDEGRFGGFDRNDMFFIYYTEPRDGHDVLHLYLPSRSAVVLKRREIVHIR